MTPCLLFASGKNGKLAALVKVDISLGFVIYALNIPLGFVRIVMIFPLGFIKNCYICR